jgi:hypothetical protein
MQDAIKQERLMQAKDAKAITSLSSLISTQQLDRTRSGTALGLRYYVLYLLTYYLPSPVGTYVRSNLLKLELTNR